MNFRSICLFLILFSFGISCKIRDENFQKQKNEFFLSTVGYYFADTCLVFTENGREIRFPYMYATSEFQVVNFRWIQSAAIVKVSLEKDQVVYFSSNAKDLRSVTFSYRMTESCPITGSIINSVGSEPITIVSYTATAAKFKASIPGTYHFHVDTSFTNQNPENCFDISVKIGN